MFSAYCERKYEVEPVEVIYADGKSYVYPDLSVFSMEVPVSYINGTIGISLGAEEVSYCFLSFLTLKLLFHELLNLLFRGCCCLSLHDILEILIL